MSRRWKAWLMLLVVGLVLPIAGSPLRFCMQSRVVVNAEESCAGCADATESECNCHQGGRSPLAPGCVTGQKLLPDATSQGDFVLPAPVVMDLLPCALPALLEIPVAGLPNLRTRERDPPHPLPLYLRQEALLL
jgi:hypothetical protein